jgi:drug/metabolite transporter (DMT)-like permease
VPPDSRTVRRAVGLSIFAALLWAVYYPLVLLATRGTPPSAVLAYPFLFGGAAYLVWAVRTGTAGAFLRLFARPSAWLRVGVLVLMQVSVLAGTYLVGPVDSSLLSLIGDVVLTPLVVALIWSARRGNIGTPLFTVGLLLSLVGGGLTIAGGQALGAVRGFGWLVVPAIPLAVAFYFLLSAQENERTGAIAVVGQSMLAAGLVCLLLAPAIPGGIGGLVRFTPLAIGLLLATGVTSFFVAPLLYFRAIDAVGMVIPPMLMTGIPVFTLLLSATVLGLGLPFIAALGIPIAVAGALLTLRGESTPAPLPAPP